MKVLSSKDIDVRPSTVDKHLISGAILKTGQPNFTFKRLVVHHDSRDSDRIKDARMQYIRSYLHYKQIELFSSSMMKLLSKQLILGTMEEHLQVKEPSLGEDW